MSPDSPPHQPGVRRRKILVGRWAGAIGRGRVDRAPPWGRWTCDRFRSRCAPAWRLRLSGWATRAPRRWSKTSRPPWACSVGRVGFGFFVMRQLQLPERLNMAQRRGSDRPSTTRLSSTREYDDAAQARQERQTLSETRQKPQLTQRASSAVTYIGGDIDTGTTREATQVTTCGRENHGRHATRLCEKFMEKARNAHADVRS